MDTALSDFSCLKHFRADRGTGGIYAEHSNRWVG